MTEQTSVKGAEIRELAPDWHRAHLVLSKYQKGNG
jgi:hypothetical protein